ncbi:MAG: phosphopantothenoylcysteine decarboxylase [Planctomycetota bacterium]|nr:phosphopantothenoylcysteine decarboxylase [Planctomycetota bacterium]
MAKILITAGPTREFIDPIRFITNQSSGRMGAALANAALELSHDVLVVSGPVQISYPEAAQVIFVQTTVEMDLAVAEAFSTCDGIIGAAAPCDFRPLCRHEQKMKKNGLGIAIEFEETNDILKRVSDSKRAGQWSVGFALETDDGLENARRKMKEKKLDLIVLNGPEALNSSANQVRVISSHGIEIESSGAKTDVARDILKVIDEHLIGG